MCRTLSCGEAKSDSVISRQTFFFVFNCLEVSRATSFTFGTRRANPQHCTYEKLFAMISPAIRADWLSCQHECSNVLDFR